MTLIDGNKVFGASGLVVAVLLAGAPQVSAADLLIRNARLIDGTAAPAREGVSILVRDGRIAEVGPTTTADGVPVIDAAGATVLPGLIDVHVHFSATPGMAFRGDTPETVATLNRRHLRAYLASGVTTVLDPGCFTEVARDLQGWLAAGNPGPRFLTTGPMVRVEGGYGHSHYGTVATLGDVEATLDLVVSLGGVGVKLAIEEGSGWFSSLRRHPAEIRHAIVEGAHRRGLPLFIHATTEPAQREALDAGARAIMHPVMGGRWSGQFFGVRDLSEDFVQRMRASGAFQVSTLSVLDTWPGLFDPARLEEPLVRLTVPAIELDTAHDAAAPSVFADGFLHWWEPRLPRALRQWIARDLWTRDNLLAGLGYSQRNLAKLHQAGVPIVVGTDAPSPWPDAIYHFHGPQTLREIELLGDAGLTPSAAIQAATLNAARMLGLEADIGTVEVGKRADLVIVRGDPLADLRALRTILWTVRDGVAGSPEEWMRR